jgi:hypothetical protein
MSNRRSMAGSFRYSRHCERSEAIHMWTAPYSQGRRVRRIGSLASICPARYDRWPRWFPRREFHTEFATSCATGLRGVSSVSDRSIHHLLVSLQGPDQQKGVFARPWQRMRGEGHKPRRSSSTSRRCEQSCWREPQRQAWAVCVSRAREAKATHGGSYRGGSAR